MSSNRNQASNGAAVPKNAINSAPSTPRKSESPNILPMDGTFMLLECIKFSLRLVDWDTIVKIIINKDGLEDNLESDRIPKNSKIEWSPNLYILQGARVTIEVQSIRLFSQRKYASFEFKLRQKKEDGDIILESAENITMKARLTFAGESKSITGVSIPFTHAVVATTLNDSHKVPPEKESHFTVHTSFDITLKKFEPPPLGKSEKTQADTSNTHIMTEIILKPSSLNQPRMEEAQFFPYDAKLKPTQVQVTYDPPNTASNRAYTQVASGAATSNNRSRIYTFKLYAEKKKSDSDAGSQKKSTANDSINVTVTSTQLGNNCFELGPMERTQCLACLRDIQALVFTYPYWNRDEECDDLLESVYKKYKNMTVDKLKIHPDMQKLFRTLKELLKGMHGRPSQEQGSVNLKDVRAILEWSKKADVSEPYKEVESSASKNEDIKSLKDIKNIAWLKWDNP